MFVDLIPIFWHTTPLLFPLKGGGGGIQAFHFGKNYFELGVGGDGQDTSRRFEGSFGSIRAILPK